MVDWTRGAERDWVWAILGKRWDEALIDEAFTLAAFVCLFVSLSCDGC